MSRAAAGLRRLVIGSLVLILVVGGYAYYLEDKEYRKTMERNVKAAKLRHDKRTEKPRLGLLRFVNGQAPVTWKTVLSGLTFGIVFGFIDNAGLWFGMEALDPYIPGGPLTKAGVGNTYSDFLGSTVGTFASVIMIHLTDVKQSPLWANTIGIFLGCLLGIVVPRWITGRR